MYINQNISKIKKKRLLINISQKRISHLLGITQSQYSRIEKGETKPHKYLKKLSEIFNCEENDIFPENSDENILNSQVKKFECTHHNKKVNSVFLQIEGWFTREEIKKGFKFIFDGMKSNLEQDYDNDY